MARTPKKPAALKIVGNTLEEFLPLLPAEEEFRKCAAAGETFEPKDYNGERPTEATKLNTIRAEFLRYMILGGCEKSPIHPVGILVKGSFIECGLRNHLDLLSTKIRQNIGLADCIINGGIDLAHATSEGLSFSGCQMKYFWGDNLITDGVLFLRLNSHISGTVSLNGVNVRGDLQLGGSKFEGELKLKNITVGENVLLHDNFTAHKPVSLQNARISGNLVCKGGKFLDPNTAISANRAKIGGNVELENMEALGTIALTGSEIGGDFQPQNAQLSGSPALQLRNTKIGGTLHWRGIDYVNGEVDLSGATCTTLNTGNTSWMRKNKDYAKRQPKEEIEQEGDQPKKADIRYVKLDNFRYQGFTHLPDDSRSSYWINWLKQQPDEHLLERFKPRPWEQLAGVLDSMGYEEEARDVRIEKQHLQTHFMATHEKLAFTKASIAHWGQILFRKFLWGPLVSYGYRPGNAILWLLMFVLFGTAIYSQAAHQGIMTPTNPLIYKEARDDGTIPKICAENWVHFKDKKCATAMPSEYSEFQPFFYALDVALPVVNFRMEDDWAPRVVRTNGTPNRLGYAVRYYEWLLIAAGWILSLLFVSAVGSSLRR